MANQPDPRKVFVVHGRNEDIRSAVFAFLRAIGLQPIEWTQAVAMTGKAAPYVGEILDAAFANAQAIIVVMTPDDEARLRQPFVKDGDPAYERDLTPQARPNVLFEAGLAFGRDANRTILVEIGKNRPFSDIAGRHTVRLDNSTKKRQDLANRLKGAGCAVDLSGTDWHKEGDFERHEPLGSALKAASASVPVRLGDEVPASPPATSGVASHVSVEQTAERLIITQRLKAVAEQLMANTQGESAASICSRFRNLCQESAVRDFAQRSGIGRQTLEHLEDSFGRLSDQARKYDSDVKQLQPANLSQESLRAICNETQEAVMAYRRMVDAFMALLHSLKIEGVETFWEKPPWSVYIHRNLADDYDELVRLVTDLRNSLQENLRSLMPQHYQLAKFPRAFLVS
ncbi:MAG: nucleotide-binding protein [Chloroflexi bacterium]|nr:nucleotide-binding protein [Chloroflexota bacterium]